MHAHIDQKHWNGKHYNRTSSIPKTKKLHTFRLRWWNHRFICTAFANQFLRSFWQSGSNNNETMHACDKRWFPYLKQDGIGWKSSIAVSYNQQFKQNATRTRLLYKNTLKIPPNERPWTAEFVDELTKKYDEGDSLSTLKKHILDDNNHGFLKFSDIQPDLKDHLNGIEIFYTLCMFLLCF